MGVFERQTLSNGARLLTAPMANVPSAVPAAGPPLMLAPCVSARSGSVKLIEPAIDAAASSDRLPATTPPVMLTPSLLPVMVTVTVCVSVAPAVSVPVSV